MNGNEMSNAKVAGIAAVAMVATSLVLGVIRMSVSIYSDLKKVPPAETA